MRHLPTTTKQMRRTSTMSERPKNQLICQRTILNSIVEVDKLKEMDQIKPKMPAPDNALAQPRNKSMDKERQGMIDSPNQPKVDQPTTLGAALINVRKISGEEKPLQDKVQIETSGNPSNELDTEEKKNEEDENPKHDDLPKEFENEQKFDDME